MARPLIIALVGIDGAGKTTQAKWLAEWLRSRAVRAAYFENPGGRPSMNRAAARFGRADGIDLLGRHGFLTVESAVRWLAIARALAVSTLTRQVAVMDRYAYCEYAIIRARGDRGERFVRAAYALFPRPDLVCLLTVAPAQAQQRIERRGMDTEELAYLAAYDAAYRSLPEARYFTLVDANGSMTEVQARIREVVDARLGARL